MTYSNMRELRAYSSRSGGAIQELMAAQLVAPAPLDEAVRATASRIGIGVRQSEMLRDLRQDAYGGRVYLPQDRLTAHSVTLEDLRDREVPPRLKPALREFKDAVQEELQSALAVGDRAAASTRRARRPPPSFAPRIAAHDFNVATSRIELGPIEKPWVAWRTARKLDETHDYPCAAAAERLRGTSGRPAKGCRRLASDGGHAAVRAGRRAARAGRCRSWQLPQDRRTICCFCRAAAGRWLPRGQRRPADNACAAGHSRRVRHRQCRQGRRGCRVGAAHAARLRARRSDCARSLGA